MRHTLYNTTALLSLSVGGFAYAQAPAPTPAADGEIIVTAQKRAERLRDVPNIHLIPPVEYADMVYLMRRAAVIVTDSGGIQEEGPALGKPVLVMRDVTERPEALATGVVKLIGTDPGLMQAEVAALLDDPAEYARRAVPVFPYGDGQAAGRIVEAIARYFSV